MYTKNHNRTIANLVRVTSQKTKKLNRIENSIKVNRMIIKRINTSTTERAFIRANNADLELQKFIVKQEIKETSTKLKELANNKTQSFRAKLNQLKSIS